MGDHYRLAVAISLKPRTVSNNWDVVQANLRRTIGSIRSSHSADIMIVIACHDEPNLGAASGGDIDILRVPFAEGGLDALQMGEDKFRKRRYIGAWLREILNGEGIYVMFLDADDLIHKEVVSYVLSDDNHRSYYPSKGYEYDCRTGMLGRRTFTGGYGSCLISYFRKEELPRSWEDEDCAYAQFKLHKDFKRVASDLEKGVDPISFRAVVYLSNHSESLRLIHMGKHRNLDLFSFVLPGNAKRVLATEFSVEESDPLISGLAGLGSISIETLVLGWSKVWHKLVK